MIVMSGVQIPLVPLMKLLQSLDIIKASRAVAAAWRDYQKAVDEVPTSNVDVAWDNLVTTLEALEKLHD